MALGDDPPGCPDPWLEDKVRTLEIQTLLLRSALVQQEAVIKKLRERVNPPIPDDPRLPEPNDP